MNNISIKVKNIPIEWHPNLPIFASETFLSAVGDKYGWIGGISDSGKLRCILPYTVIKRNIFNLIRFRVETIPIGADLDINEEKLFLNRAVEYFKETGADVIIPATTNTIFNTYPDRAMAAPYGSYIVDLRQPESVLWQNIKKTTRQNIRTAQKSGVNIQCVKEYNEETYNIVKDTFKRANLSFMNEESFKRYLNGLGNNGKIIVAYNGGKVESVGIYAYSNFCAYAVYAGNIAIQRQGVNKLLDWEAICLFKKLGVQYYDFVGARIEPQKGSRKEGINSYKRRFGAELKQGYMWKYPLRPVRSLVYSIAVKLIRGGDIVDQERYKLVNERTPEQK